MYPYRPEGWLCDTPENRSALADSAALARAAQQGQILEAHVVMCDNAHDLIVDLGCMRGVIPKNEGALGIADGSVREIALISRVGKPVCFRITGFATDPSGKPYALLSRRVVQAECMERFIRQLSPGDIIDARVTHLEPFGCFVDIGCGIASLIPIDAISVSRIAHPRDRFTVGQDIRAVVRAVDDCGRVSLTHRELWGTWEENAARFSTGQTVTGIVRSVEEYGVFVELAPNLAGLAEPHPGAAPGQCASVYIKNLIREKMKVKLIIVDTFEGGCPPPVPGYFLHTEHIDHWRYSPADCARCIESRFSPEDPGDI